VGIFHIWILIRLKKMITLTGVFSLILQLLVCCEMDKYPYDKNPVDGGELSISGFVFDSNGSVEDAVVRIQCTEISARTDSFGYFLINGLNTDGKFRLTAWAYGYYIAGGKRYLAGTDSVEFKLTPLLEGDNPDYKWLSSYSSQNNELNCENCHSGSNESLPFDEWIRDAHSQSAGNIRFLNMYLGTDVIGNKSPLTRFGYNRDYGKFPLPPDYDHTWFGPGYKLDFPDTEGNCATCHTPLTAINDPYGTDPSELDGAAAEGINCDFCHKIWDVKLNPENGLPFENRPGILSYEFKRPFNGHQFFAGPFDDVAPGEDTYTPIQKESAYCAPCHFGKFWEVEIYNSYGEWLESPYSDPETGQTCQDCHMPPGLNDHFASIDAGGNIRESSKIHSHLMPGTRDEKLLRNALSLNATAVRKEGEIRVQIEITNDKTGHHVPTDSPLRHLILIVEARDSKGNMLNQNSGPIIPEWCGVGDQEQGNYSGYPGKVYAKILKDSWTGLQPTAAYWNKIQLISDNRIAANQTDYSSFTFNDSPSNSVDINIKLIYRRAYKQLMDSKGWTDPDIIMVERLIRL